MANKVCPVWVGYLLNWPGRKLFQNPDTILSPHIRNGMTVLDIGCAMGFFSLPLAQMAGPGGRVLCVDVQEKMLTALLKRARKAGLAGRIETRTCRHTSLDLDDLIESVDFALASAVIHEATDPAGFFSDVYDALKPAGKLLVIEPRGHVSEKNFDQAVSFAEEKGFRVVERPPIRRSRTVLLEKI